MASYIILTLHFNSEIFTNCIQLQWSAKLVTRHNSTVSWRKQSIYLFCWHSGRTGHMFWYKRICYVSLKQIWFSCEAKRPFTKLISFRGFRDLHHFEWHYRLFITVIIVCISHFNRSFSYDVTAAMLVDQATNFFVVLIPRDWVKV